MTNRELIEAIWILAGIITLIVAVGVGTAATHYFNRLRKLANRIEVAVEYYEDEKLKRL